MEQEHIKEKQSKENSDLYEYWIDPKLMFQEL